VRPRQSCLEAPAGPLRPGVTGGPGDPISIPHSPLLLRPRRPQASSWCFSKADRCPEACAGPGTSGPQLGLQALIGACPRGKALAAPASLASQALAAPAGRRGGKTALLNALTATLSSVAAVKREAAAGRHTTRHVELFPLGPRCLLAWPRHVPASTARNPSP